MRSRHDIRLQDENRRLAEELKNLKATHGDQVAEVSESQNNEIQDMKESHRKTLQNAREKFIKEKSKFETA
jgi:ElaB/YqjD/DUF883 family membrane-anchored ribosome-binding protein